MDFTVEKPRFSRVWKLDTAMLFETANRRNDRSKDILLLCSLDIHQQTAQPIYAFLKRRGLFRYLSWFGRCFTSRLALNHDVKINELVGERAHVVFEAEGVFADAICGEDIVSLSLTLAVEENLFIRVFHFIVDIE